jgi:glutathione synthase/RimK-type ligase-like ATP-grasp enzyme
MRILLTDGSGLTARQAAAQLADAGHAVEVLSPNPFCLARFTRRVRRVWRVPPYGADPLRWLDVALAVFGAAEADVLLPTQEQAAVLSACDELVRAAEVRTAVPSFAALSRVQDKLSAFATLIAAGLPQPEGAVLTAPAEVMAWDRFPVFMKLPIGTATTGVRRICDGAQLPGMVSVAQAAGAFGDGGVLAQLPAAGPLVMVQAVFAEGALVACHANLRVREGAGGGASHKRSVLLPTVREHMQVLGHHLRWHGALSADAILTGQGPRFIDINPRLVEPANALRAGVDLVTPLLELSRGGTPHAQPPGRAGVPTHQLLLAVLGAAQQTGRRWPVIAELAAAARHSGDYRGSTEELTPVRGDLRAAIPVVVAAAATIIWPASWRWFASGSVASYSLSPAGWRQLRDHRSQRTAG